MAGEKGKWFVTCLEQPQKSQLPPLWLPYEFQWLQLPQTLISASPTQGSAQIPLSALQGGHCLQVEGGNQGADLVTFLRDCNFALLVDQRPNLFERTVTVRCANAKGRAVRVVGPQRTKDFKRRPDSCHLPQHLQGLSVRAGISSPWQHSEHAYFPCRREETPQFCLGTWMHVLNVLKCHGTCGPRLFKKNLNNADLWRKQCSISWNERMLINTVRTHECMNSSEKVTISLKQR